MVLGCGFDIKKLPIKLPKFYEDCFQIFAEHSAATAASVQCLNNNTIADTIVWNNKHICVDNKSVFHRSLFKKGIITLEDLVNENNDLIVKQSSNKSHFTSTEVFLLMQVIDALCINQFQRCPFPLPGNRGAFAQVVSPGGGVLAILSRSRGAEHSCTPGRPPRI